MDLDFIPRIENPTRAVFEEEVLPAGRPVIFTGAMADWEACGRWTPAYLAAACGARIVPVEYYPQGNRCGQWSFLQIPLARYLELSASPAHRNYYLAEIPLAEVLPSLIHEVRRPHVVDPARIRKEVIFIGRDSFTTLHYHRGTQALLAQVSGRKRVLLYRPQDTPLLYPERWYSLFTNFSRIDLEDVAPGTAARFPLYARARPLQCTLEAGEMLFIPVQWWHAARGEGLSISVTTFWKARLREWTFPVPGLRDLCHLPVRKALLLADGAARRLGLQTQFQRLGQRLGLLGAGRRYLASPPQGA